MPIQRQYSLPNCSLILEGFGTTTDNSPLGERPELSVLTRFECYFAREQQSLVGGVDLLQSLRDAAHHAVQACISGIPAAPEKVPSNSERVQIQTAQTGGFDLVVPGEFLFQKTADGMNQSEVHLHLSSVQLFDLMEAMDQLATDQQTLPEFQSEIQPRPRKEVLAQRSSFEQSAPLALGAASVAAAAAAIFFIPAPKVPVPQESQNKPTTIERPVQPRSTAAPTAPTTTSPQSSP
jgi:hypothetical protein